MSNQAEDFCMVVSCITYPSRLKMRNDVDFFYIYLICSNYPSSLGRRLDFFFRIITNCNQNSLFVRKTIAWKDLIS